MKIITYDNSFKLEDTSIDAFSEVLDKAFAGINMERQNRLRIRLSLEESLLRIRDRFGEDQVVKAHIGKRFGKLVVRIEFENDPYNPLTDDENVLSDVCSSLLTEVGLSPLYMNINGTNALQISVLIPSISPAIKIIIAVLGGLLVGVIGNLLLSDPVKTMALNSVMSPLNELWLRILNVSSGPIIFFMVITTIMNTGKISERGGSARNTIARYFIFSFIMATVTMIFASQIFSLNYVDGSYSSSTVSDIMYGIARLIPNDIPSAFAQTNTPQILILAFVLGFIFHLLGNQIRTLRRVVRQINMVGLELARFISRLVPFFATVLIGLEIWQTGAEVFAEIGECLLIALSISIICMLVALLAVSIKQKTKVKTLEAKLREPFWITLKSGTLDAAFGITENNCSSLLGIDRKFSSISLPNGLVLYMPISAIGTLTFVTYVTMEYNVSTSPLWYVSAVIFAVLLFVATPPVPGANLLAYVVLFSQLGIPKIALIDAMVFDIIFGLFASAGNLFLLQLELINQSEKMGLLDKQKLRSKMPAKKK